MDARKLAIVELQDPSENQPLDFMISSDESVTTFAEFLRDSDDRQAKIQKDFDALRQSRIDKVNGLLNRIDEAVSYQKKLAASPRQRDLGRLLSLLTEDQAVAHYSETEMLAALEDELSEGVCGLATLPIIHLLELAIADGETCIVPSGKIRDYVFDASNGSGHLSVETKFEFFSSYDNFRSNTVDRTVVYHWDVEVPASISDPDKRFRVLHRQGDPIFDPHDPFPQTVDFPFHATNPKDKRSVWYRGLDRKLYARGDGIKVHHIYRQIDDGPIRRLSDANPAYRSDPDSCIDLMFEGEPPALKLPPQPSYCLGRCAHPQIINTSGG